MLMKPSTDKTVTETAAALHAAVFAHHLGVMNIHDLKQTMANKGLAFGREYLVLEVCQPQQGKTVLERDMSISTVLPCRISVYQEDGKTILATLKPTVLLAMFSLPLLGDVAREVETTILEIMQEAA